MKAPRCKLCKAEHWGHEAHVVDGQPVMAPRSFGSFSVTLAPSVTESTGTVTESQNTVTEIPISVTVSPINVTEEESVTKKGRPQLGGAASQAERARAYRERKKDKR